MKKTRPRDWTGTSTQVGVSDKERIDILALEFSKERKGHPPERFSDYFRWPRSDLDSPPG